jgi:2-amino-4-hydroxy-6-hydroxymethyldihydropteridine diphosphokinase
MTTTFLGLGSNLGDRQRNLRKAVGLLGDALDIVRVSSIYETDPVGVHYQPPFLNVVLQAETNLEPSALLATVKGIERDVGRVYTFRWGPRVLDVDILLYGDRTVDEPALVIPHPEMRSRAFVLVPLCEIAPQACLPDGEALCPPPEALSSQRVRMAGSL